MSANTRRAVITTLVVVASAVALVLAGLASIWLVG